MSSWPSSEDLRLVQDQIRIIGQTDSGKVVAFQNDTLLQDFSTTRCGENDSLQYMSLKHYNTMGK